MAASSNSSRSSNTATHAPALAFLSAFTDSSRPTGAADMLALLDTIRSGNRHGLLQAAPAIPNASLQLAKSTLDAYAAQVSDEQQERQKEANKKRKRQGGGGAVAEVLKIRKLHIDGFESAQVWQQARRIIDSTLQHSQEALQELQDSSEVQVPGVNGASKVVEFDEDGSDLESGEEPSDEEGSDQALGSDVADEEDLEDGDEDAEEYLDDEMAEINGDEEDYQEGSEDEDDEDDQEEFVEDPDGLNDGFFSLDTFNKQTQWFENQDAKADPTTDQASDDEEIDWHADPMSAKPAAKASSSKKSTKAMDDEPVSDMDEDDEDDDEGGATFGDMDLDAPEGASDEEDFEDELDDGNDMNANDVFYKDFFAPPQKKASKDRKPRKPKASSRPAAPDEQDVERAMADVRRDLFEDESEREDSDDALSDVSAGDPRSRKSAHERREAKLAEEIRKLEAANVAKREWTMAGEAKAADRPMNSLLEQDLDFEHVGKPVPVITAEVSESIEDMIKRRILAQEFDEVIRRRPGSDEFGSAPRRGLVDVDDSKNKQSLAEIYEEQHVKDSNPDTYVSKSDEKVRKEEKEIETMWKDVCSKLDALSSWHYRPKAAAPSLTVVSDVATISMEDAQPATAQGVSGGDQTLAPQEIYKAGKANAEKGEVVAKSGLPVAREEMSREEKLRRRRREKERIRKSGPVSNRKPQSAKAQARKDTMGDLKKGGVKVINKKGEVVDMDGNKAKAAGAVSSGNFKL